MAYRNFTDRQGRKWEVRERSRAEWDLVPVGDNRARERTVRSPGYEKDPFELSIEELQRLVDEPETQPPSRPHRSPFKE